MRQIFHPYRLEIGEQRDTLLGADTSGDLTNQAVELCNMCQYKHMSSLMSGTHQLSDCIEYWRPSLSQPQAGKRPVESYDEVRRGGTYAITHVLNVVPAAAGRRSHRNVVDEKDTGKLEYDGVGAAL